MARTTDEILAEAENPAHARIESAFILQRQDLQIRYDELQGELRAARRRSDSISNGFSAELERQVAELEAEMAEALIEYRFKNIGHRAWADLLAEHPPSEEQRAANRLADHNPDTLKPAVMAKACVEPDGATVAFFNRLSEVYSPDQFEVLWLACYKANMGASGLPKALTATRGQTLQANEPSESSATAEDAPSLEASFLGE